MNLLSRTLGGLLCFALGQHKPEGSAGVMYINPKEIQCPYCAKKASPLRGPVGKAIKDTDTRYGCDNGHYFAVPTKSVLVKDDA